jgi:hypothetical protein
MAGSSYGDDASISGSVTINDDGIASSDLRVESDNETHMFFVDASTNHVGVGTSSPQVPLDIYEMGGLILGYTRLNNSGGSDNTTYQVQDSGTGFAVPTNRWRTDFTAPASGKVEINFRGALVSNTTGGSDWVALGLSDSDTYNSIGSKYEKVVDTPTEVASAGVTHRIVNHSWFCDGLTAGTSYSIYIGTVGRTTAHYWYWGGSDSYEHADIIITTTALPNTFVTD